MRGHIGAIGSLSTAVESKILGHMLVLAGHEGCHVVECNCFHRSEFGWNGLFLLCLPSIPGFPRTASVLAPVICPWSVKCM